MLLEREIQHMGTKFSEKVEKILCKEIIKPNEQLREAFNFKEDNTMSNSPEVLTTTLAKFIYYKSYNQFKKYFDMTWNLTPADLGMPEGSGVYKIPKIVGSKAAKLSSGEVVEYINKDKDKALLETETYGIGTRINRRYIKRAAKGVIQKQLTAASDAVLREVASDLVNGMVNGAASANTVTGGISWDNIADSKYNIRNATNTNGVLFGFIPDTLALSNLGENVLLKSSDYKTAVQYGQRNVPGEELETDYIVFSGLKVFNAELINVQKGGSDVHGVVMQAKDFTAFLKETEMETFDGRIPGTAGDTEIIHAMDAGFVVLNEDAGSVITA